MFQFKHRVDRFIRHELDRILITQIIRPFDSVVHVPFRFVFFVIAQRGRDTALRRTRVRACGIHLADHCGICRFGCVQTGHESRAAAADNHHIKLMNFCHELFLFNNGQLTVDDIVHCLSSTVRDYAVQIIYNPIGATMKKPSMLRMRIHCRSEALAK